MFFQVGGVGPMFGQVGYFYKFAGKAIEDKRPLQRYADETRRLLGVLEKRLESRDWIMGADYTIADIAIFPWVRALTVVYDAGELLGSKDFPKVNEWVKRAEARPASRTGLNIPARR